METNSDARATILDEARSSRTVFPEVDQQPRGYQIELFEESLRQNIIISMPTGSGKTLVAAMRARETLEHRQSGQIVWMCVPKVQLAIQQHNVLSTQAPMFKSRLLTGVDNCEFWSQDIWKQVLEASDIVVSTYSILLDALKHAYLSLSQVALLIFDEAHHAVKNHPASQIMRLFYHQMPKDRRPGVLGLTATPANRLEAIDELEINMAAICKTPEVFEAELQDHVHVPVLIKLSCSTDAGSSTPPQSLLDLETVVRALNIQEDPWVRRKKESTMDSDVYALQKALVSGQTYCHKQLRSLLRKAAEIFVELGSWSSHQYIYQCISRFSDQKTIKFTIFDDLDDHEKHYLTQKLSLVSLTPAEDLTPESCASSKLQALIGFLSGEEVKGFTGLVFVKTRAQVAILAHTLTKHPATSKFGVSTFVGSSSFAGRKQDISELANPANQQQTLNELRAGRVNIIITTDALEEGIDVVSCNVVICFENPTNIRSFVQRRGRARNPTSRYVVFEHRDVLHNHQASTWEAMERAIKDLLQQERKLEAFEDGIDGDNRVLRHGSSGARLGPADTVAHLHHFCDLLSVDPFVDTSPVYTYEVKLDGEKKMFRASVRLPNILSIPALRYHRGSKFWFSEKSARHDAAFEAYCALFNAGDLLNEHLLPRSFIDPEIEAALANVEIRPNVASVAGQINIWQTILSAPSLENHISKVLMHLEGEATLEMYCVMPISIPAIEPLSMFWSSSTVFFVDIQESLPANSSSELSQMASQVTTFLLSLYLPSRIDHDKGDFLASFAPAKSIPSIQSFLQQYLGSFSGDVDFTDACPRLIRDISRNGKPFIMTRTQQATKDEVMSMQASSSGCGPYQRYRKPHLSQQLSELSTSRVMQSGGKLHLLGVHSTPKRLEFSHAQSAPSNEPALQWLLADFVRVEKVPLPYVYFAFFIPCILHRIEQSLIVEHLRQSLFANMPNIDPELVRESILASSARCEKDYQRLEFLGDSILKFTTSLMLMVSHLQYTENILSKMKDHIVSNARLSRAAIDLGLAQFIITRPFVGRKWKPTYLSDLSSLHQAQREMSTKILADVVEAFIGAAYLSGGYSTSNRYIQLLLPGEAWKTIPEAFDIFDGVYEQRSQSTAITQTVEKVCGYTFRQKSLAVEAITHPSQLMVETDSPYERLEFLGDAVLDNIVTDIAFRHTPALPVKTLHLIRSVLVNGHFLGFKCLEFSVQIPQADLVTNDRNHIKVVQGEGKLHFWHLLRHASPQIRFALNHTLERFKTLQTAISDVLMNGTCHPWTLLAQLDPPKPLSDIVEAVLGAIFIDSKGDMAECRKFLQRMGLFTYLERVLLNSDIALLHPKEDLGQLANQYEVRYEMGHEGEGINTKLTCAVHVGERQLVKVVDGTSPLAIQTKAAESACHILRAEGMDVDIQEEFAENDHVERHSDDDDDDDDDGENGDHGPEGTPLEGNLSDGGVRLPPEMLSGKAERKRKRDRINETALGYDSEEYLTADE